MGALRRAGARHELSADSASIAFIGADRFRPPTKPAELLRGFRFKKKRVS